MRYRDRAPSLGVLLTLALLGMGFALGCSREEPTPPASAPTSATEPASPSSPDPSGEVMVIEGVLPEGFPSDVPIYPASEPLVAMEVTGLGVFATFQSNDPVEPILEHFRSALESNGWTVGTAMEEDGLDATKDERTVEVRVRPRNGVSEIAINLASSQNPME